MGGVSYSCLMYPTSANLTYVPDTRVLADVVRALIETEWISSDDGDWLGLGSDDQGKLVKVPLRLSSLQEGLVTLASKARHFLLKFENAFVLSALRSHVGSVAAVDGIDDRDRPSWSAPGSGAVLSVLRVVTPRGETVSRRRRDRARSNAARSVVGCMRRPFQKLRQVDWLVIGRDVIVAGPQGRRAWTRPSTARPSRGDGGRQLLRRR